MPYSYPTGATLKGRACMDTSMHDMGSLGHIMLPLRLGEPGSGPGCVEGGGQPVTPQTRE